MVETLLPDDDNALRAKIPTHTKTTAIELPESPGQDRPFSRLLGAAGTLMRDIRHHVDA